MAIKTQTREVGPLAMRAAFKPGSVNVAARTAQVIWTTGARVRRNDWDGSFDEELSLDPKHVRMDRLNNGAPLLDSHRAHAQIGVVESAQLEGNQGTATVRFSERAEAEVIFKDVISGVIQNISVGYRVHKFEKVEGGDSKIPVMRATDWQPFEISVVAMGADDGAGFRSADATQTNPCTFVSISPEGRTMTEAERLAQIETEKAAVAQRAAEAEALTARVQRAERERVSGITAAFRSFNAETRQTHAAKLAEFCAGEATLDQARAFVLEALATESDASPNRASGIERGTDDTDQFVRGVSDALLSRGGNEYVSKAISRKLPGFDKIGDGAQYRGMNLSDVARLCLRRAGVKGVDQIYDRERLAIMAMEQRSGYATPSDFPILMEDIARKSMRAGYAIQPETWRRWCGTDSVSNFLDSSRFQKGAFTGPLPVVAADAEYQNMAIPDGAKIAINTETRGAIVAMGRQMLINDDLGAFTNVASEFGALAGKSIELAAYTFLAQNTGLGPSMADTEPYFHAANRGNVVTSAALTGAALGLDRLHMRTQLNVGGSDFLDLEPRILLIPVGLEDAARALNTDAFDHSGTALQKNNQRRGMFSDIVSSPRLTASTTRRYLFTEDKNAFKVVFLDGSGEGPTLSSQEGFRRDGMEFKARIDFKLNAYDPKSVVTNAGT